VINKRLQAYYEDLKKGEVIFKKEEGDKGKDQEGEIEEKKGKKE